MATIQRSGVKRSQDPDIDSDDILTFDDILGRKIQGITLIDDEGNLLPYTLEKRIEVSAVPFTQDIVRGNISGARRINAMGEKEGLSNNPAQDIWEGPTVQIPIPSPSGEQMTVVSSDANDTDAGTGINQVRICYLDAGGIEQIENIIMNGTTPVNTVATDITFINEFHAVEVGTNQLAEGDITIYQLGDPGLVYAKISQGTNLSRSSMRKIQTGKTGYIKWFCATSSSGRALILRLLATTNRVALPGIFLFQSSGIIESAPISFEIDPPIKCPAGTIIKVAAWPTLPGGDVSCSWQGWEE